MKKHFIFLSIVVLLLLTLAFATSAFATPALSAGSCYRESCDGTFSHLTSNHGVNLLDESQSLIVDTGPATGLNVGSLRLYHDLGSKSMHGTVHENSAGMAATLTFTTTITQTDGGAGADTIQAGTQATCGQPDSVPGFCDTLQIGTDGTLADCFVVSLTWAVNGVPQSTITSINGDAPYCVTG